MRLLTLSNPYLSFVLAFSVALIFYSPNLSYLFPVLGLLTYLVVAFAVLIAFYFAIISQRYVSNISASAGLAVKKRKSSDAFRILLFVLPFAVAEIVVYPNFPLLSAIRGGDNHKEFVSEYGIPTFHAIIVILCQVVVVQGFNEIYYGKERSKRVVFAIFGGLSFLLIFLSRGALAISLMASLFCYMANSRRFSVVRMIGIFSFAISALYIFGWLGNLRTGDPEFILSAGGANESVFGGAVPSELFWAYIYMVSPIANLQLAIEYYSNVGGLDLWAVFALDIVPDVISKRMTDLMQVWNDARPLIHPAFTVGTAFVRPYYYAGMLGVGMVFIWWIFITYISLKGTRAASPYAMTMLGFINVLGFLCIFTNTVVFSSIIGPIFLCVGMDLIARIRWRNNT